MKKRIATFAAATVTLLSMLSMSDAQTLVPNAQQTFLGQNGTPLAGGFVYTYVPGTTTPKVTWSDVNLSVPNTNPVVLDANGQARIWGTGVYREVLQDSIGNLVWDALTSVPGGQVVPSNVALRATAGSPGQIVWRSGYYVSGDGGALSYLWSSAPCSIAAGAGDGGAQVPASGGGCWIGQFPNGEGNVLAWGAKADGTGDSAPAWRAAFASGPFLGGVKIVTCSPGTYQFASLVASPYPYINSPSVLVQNVSGLTIHAEGCSFVMSNGATFSTNFMFDRSSEIHWFGGQFVGNRSGLSANQVNNPITTTNLDGFSFKQIYVSGNWGGPSSIFEGDWLVNGVVDDVRADAVGQCFDWAFLKNVTISNVRANGADENGGAGANQTGEKCFSIIHDGPAVSDNHLPAPYSTIDTTSGVTITKSSVMNFNTGGYVSSGSDISFIGNTFSANVGHNSLAPGGAVPGVGLLIDYVQSGNFASTGFPPKRIFSLGDHFIGNGNGDGGGGGILVTAPPAGADEIDGLMVESSFVGNSPNGIETQTIGGGLVSQLSNLILHPLCSDFTPQTACIGGNIGAAPSVANNVLASLRTTGGSYVNKGNIKEGASTAYISSLNGTAVTVASGGGACGTSATIAGNNVVGRVVVGSGGNGGVCTVTFSTTWPNNPLCSVWNETSGARQPFPTPTATTLAINAQSTFSAGDILGYHCRAYE